MPLVYKREPTLFAISLILAIIFWIAVIGGTLGLALLYLLGFFIIYLFAQSAFISRLKGAAVLITPEQFPDLHTRITACCKKLEINPQPEAYLLHGNGVFNALATRFLGDNFIVLFSDVVDALDDNPEAINFYIGHELGHIHRKHLQWSPVLWPAGLLPLLGAAYSRAREYTCDSYGLHCCADVKSATQGLTALAAGHNRWQTINVDQYVKQAADTGGFWMSFHELIFDYPWLVKRVARIRAGDTAPELPGRNPLAWLLALFVPRLGLGGGAGGIIIFVAIIGILAAIALPAYQDYVARAKLAEVTVYGERATQAVGEYLQKNNRIPGSLEQTGIAGSPLPASISEATIDGKNAIIRLMIRAQPMEGKSLLFIPSQGADKQVTWRCASQDIPVRYLPARCKPPA